MSISRIALGLGLRGQKDAESARKLVRTALDNGVNLVDCANVYGLTNDSKQVGGAEKILGQLLKGRNREDTVIATKVGAKIGPGVNDTGASRLHIMREVERSLSRLQTDWIDIYFLHKMDYATPFEEQLRAMEDLVAQGKVLYVGVSNYQAWQAMAVLTVQNRVNAHRLAVVQNPFSLMNREIEDELLPMTRFANLGVMVYGALGSGFLATEYESGDALPENHVMRNRPEVYSRLMHGRIGEVMKTLRAISQKRDLTLAQVATAWVLGNRGVDCLVSGADTPNQLLELIDVVGTTLEPSEQDALNKVSHGLKVSTSEI